MDLSGSTKGRRKLEEVMGVVPDKDLLLGSCHGFEVRLNRQSAHQISWIIIMLPIARTVRR
jgi:hypothetical protein